jgi:Flp pilus assembly protein TadD
VARKTARPPERTAWIVAGLVALVLAAYAPVRHNGFVHFDDGTYLFENRIVQQGLTLPGVAWAFSTCHAANWHPLTWLSHMLDCELFGLDAGAHHAVGVLLHAASAVSLFLALRALGGAPWPAAFVAALFAVHPLRVESVAWAAERKDLLAGLFWMLGLAAWARYARRPSAGRYLLVAGALGAGLLAKPMAVTLPLVLLLLDAWPLRRWRLPSPPPRRLVLEKLPLLALSLLSSAATLACQRGGGTLAALDSLPFGARLANALVACVAYLWKTIWPVGLAFYYPHPNLVASRPFDALLVPALACGLLLAGVSAAVLLEAGRRPYLLAGWLWYLGTLAPVIGLVQVGNQAMADRYAYLPLIGVYVMIAWGGSELVAARRGARPILWLAAALALGGSVVATRAQLAHWRDSPALFRHALRVTRDNALAHNNLGSWLARQGDVGQAETHFREAIRIKPDYASAHENLGLMFARRDDLDGAERQFRRALALAPDLVDAWVNLGVLYAKRGEPERAREQLERALRLAPERADVRFSLGVVLVTLGRVPEARAHLERALEIQPDHAAARQHLERLSAAP